MSKTKDAIEALRRRAKAAPDGRMPSKSALAKELKMSPASVSNAIRALKDEGSLRSVPGKGVFIAGAEPKGRGGEGLLIGLSGCYLPGADAFAAKGAGALEGRLLLKGVFDAAQEASCAVAMLPWGAKGVFDAAAARKLRLDGLIIAGGAPEKELLKVLRCGVPAVLANYPAIPQPPLPFLDFDNAWAVAESVKLLKKRGRKRLAFIAMASGSVPGYMQWIRERFIVALAEAGLSFRPELCVERADAPALFEGKERPDGVVCWHQDFLERFVETAERRGLRVPQDVSAIAACASAPSGKNCCFVQPAEKLGKALFKALTERRRDPFAQVSCFIKPRLFEGGPL